MHTCHFPLIYASLKCTGSPVHKQWSLSCPVPVSSHDFGRGGDPGKWQLPRKKAPVTCQSHTGGGYQTSKSQCLFLLVCFALCNTVTQRINMVANIYIILHHILIYYILCIIYIIYLIYISCHVYYIYGS